MGPDLRQSLSEAEVVIFELGPARFGGPVWRYASDSPGSCGGTDNQDCLREALKAYQEDTDGIFAEIVSLRSPSETLIRTMDIHQVDVKELKEAEAFDVVNSYWREANGYLIEVATEHHIPVAQVYAAFMGATGDEDPQDKGLVQSDGLHPTGEGADLIAELFRDLGYEYAPSEP
jgi:lysophospholipase L1-like esterase